MSKIIQSVRFFGYMIGKLGEETLSKFAISLAKDIFPTTSN